MRDEAARAEAVTLAPEEAAAETAAESTRDANAEAAADELLNLQVHPLALAGRDFERLREALEEPPRDLPRLRELLNGPSRLGHA